MKKLWDKIKGLPRFGKVLLALGLALGIFVVIYVGYGWMSIDAAEEEEPAAVPARLQPPPEEDIPEAYLFQHFLSEMADCYDQVSQPVGLAQLERDIGREWGKAANALLDYYERGLCVEGAEHLRIPGRAGWLAAQAAQFAVESMEEEEESNQ